MKTILLCMAITALASCNSKKDSAPAAEPVRKQFQGDLEKKALEVYSSENEFYFYDCDSRQHKMVLELTAAVENNRENIVALQKKTISQNTEIQVVNLNGYDFIEQKATDRPDKWEEDRYSWSDLYKTYLDIKMIHKTEIGFI